MITVTAAAETAVSLFEAIEGRRSVRSYKPPALDGETIQALLHAAVRAPTAIHMEPWAFAIVQDAAILQRLSDSAKATLAERAAHHATDRGGHLPDAFLRKDFNIFYDAGTLIVICAQASSEFVVADCWLAAENLMLAAHAKGLGSCVIGSALGALNTPDGKNALGIAAEYTAIAAMVVGVPREAGAGTPRKPPVILSWKK